MVERPLVSFLIPAFHSPGHLKECISSIIDLCSRDFECIVGVSSNDTASLAILKLYGRNKQIKILEYGAPDVPMVSAYENLLSEARGEWMSIVGQDDGVLPWFFPELHFLLKKWPSAEAFSFSRAYFFWSHTESTFGDRAVDIRGRRWSQLRKTDTVLARCLLGVMEHYELPQTYTNNLIKRSAIELVKSLSGGRFYLEPVPDVYSGVALGVVLKSFVFSGLPLFWTGTSSSSAGYKGHTAVEEFDPDQFSHRRSRESHSRRWKEAGYDFNATVGEELWLGANSTPLYVLSALSTFPSKAQIPHYVLWSQIAFANALGDIWISLRQEGLTRVIKLHKVWWYRVKRWSASPCVLLVVGSFLFPIVHILRLKRKVGRRINAYLPVGKTGWSVRFRSSDKVRYSNLREINSVMRTLRKVTI